MEDNGIHIRLWDVVYGLGKHRTLAVALSFSGFLLGFLLSGGVFFSEDRNRGFQITSSFSVNTDGPDGEYASGRAIPGYNDFLMASGLVGSASYLVQSDRMLQDIIDTLVLSPMTPEDIRKNLTVTQYAQTQIIELTLSWQDASQGIQILTELNQRTPALLQSTLGVGTVSVINPPTAQLNSLGRTVALWIGMALLGFAAAFFFIVAEQLLYPTVLDPRLLETILGAELLCQIRKGAPIFSTRRSPLAKGSRNSEAARALDAASHILNTRLAQEAGPHILAITSVQPHEGRTGLTANLSVCLSHLGKRVLLVDLDLQNPKLAARFLKDIKPGHSLNALYTGSVTPEEGIIKLRENLDLLPTVAEQNGVSWDDKLVSIIERLSGGYDYVILDTPPLGRSSDSMRLNRIAAGVVLVVRYDTAPLRALQESRRRIERSDGRLLGCVANCVPSRLLQTKNES